MKIAILGGGTEGKSLIRYFSQKGADITLCDKNKLNLQDFEVKNITLRFGPDYLDNLEEFDLVFRSPGIPFLTPIIQRAIEKGAKLTSLTEYFFQNCPAPIIGVTGTKGKGTTATLLYNIFKIARPGRVHLAGNIGNSPLDCLPDIKKDDFVILELSSFQLQDLEQSPYVAIVLGISEDHLDHHKNMKEYIEAKKNIVRFQKKDDIAIVNIDTEYSRMFLHEIKSKDIWRITNETPQENRTPFQNGGLHSEGTLFIVDNKKRHALLSVLDLPLLGKHNISNVLAASCAAYTLGVPIGVIREGIQSFQGLPHRLEFVAEINGVKFFNDSASTNPETAAAAIQSFHQPVILIAGGSEKYLDYTKLGETIIKSPNVKTAILMGETSPRIEKAIDEASKHYDRSENPLELIIAENYQEAFMTAKLTAKPGDIVLLSPASASFDMFSGYQERGDIFRDFVKNL